MTALSEEVMLDLMAYSDGELDGEAKVRVEALIAENPDAARIVAELQTLGDCVRVTEEARPIPDSVASIVDHVMVQVARVHSERVAAAIPIGVRRRRAGFAAAASGVLALAAAWALFLRHPEVDVDPSDEDLGPTIASVAASAAEQATVAAVTPPAIPADAPPPGVNVDSVESASHQVSVFYVPAVAEGSANASSVIVWIGDNP